MESFSWIAALALSLAVPATGGSQSDPAAHKDNPAPAAQSVTPGKRAEDRPAHESPYSAFGAPHAKAAPAKRRSGPRVHCKDGSIQTAGQKGDRAAVCKEHGGVKQQ